MRIVALCLAVALSGCVLKSKYEALDKTLADTKASMQGDIDQRDKKAKDLEAEIAKLKAKIKTLNGEIAALKKTISEQKAQAAADAKTHEDRVGELQAELAKLFKDRSRLRASAKELKRALAEMSKRKAEADKRVAQFKGLLARFKSLIDAGKLKVKMVDGRMVLALATDVLFDSGKAKLSEEGTLAIAQVASVLATMKGRKFQVEGHTDNVPIKSARYPSNWELAAGRALVVVKTMIGAGMPAQHINAASFGEFRPMSNNETEEGRLSNRRIEIVVVPDLSSLPGFSELNTAVGTK
jgi:chemotaxis protein MotB